MLDLLSGRRGVLCSCSDTAAGVLAVLRVPADVAEHVQSNPRRPDVRSGPRCSAIAGNSAWNPLDVVREDDRLCWFRQPQTCEEVCYGRACFRPACTD